MGKCNLQNNNDRPVIFELYEDGDFIRVETTNPDYIEYNIKVSDDLLYATMSDIASCINNDSSQPRAVVFTLG